MEPATRLGTSRRERRGGGSRRASFCGSRRFRAGSHRDPDVVHLTRVEAWQHLVEQRPRLFAAAYAACFQSSMERFAAGRKLDLRGSRITARVGIGTLATGGLGITAALDLDAPTIRREDALYLMRRAHETCPYSRATRGNIEVTLSVGGTSVDVDLQAA
jgi:Ohr subfamily peroxiredoxin